MTFTASLTLGRIKYDGNLRLVKILTHGIKYSVSGVVHSVIKSRVFCGGVKHMAAAAVTNNQTPSHGE